MKFLSTHPGIRHLSIVVVLLGLFYPIKLTAQVKTLTLKNALQYALQNKSDAKKAILNIENSRYQVDEAKARALPQISGSGGLTYNPILQLSALPGEVLGQPGTTILLPFGQKWNATAGLSLSQTVYDQSVFAALKAAKATQQYYALNAQLTDEQVIENVANNYYQVLIKRQQLVVIDSNLKNTEKTKRIIEGQYKNGLAKKIDFDRVKVNIANINAERQQQINAIQLQENQLKFYIGMPIENRIDIPQSEFDAITPQLAQQTQAPDVTKLVQYQVLKKQEELLKAQKQSQKAAYFPTLSFSSNYNYQGIGNKFPLGNGSSNGVNWSDYASVGLSLKVPIFNGFATRAKVRQAEVSIKSLKEDIDNTTLSLNLGFENAKSQISNSLITLANQKENVRLAREVADNTRNNYNNGLATLTDLLDAETDLVEAENNNSTALLDYRLAQIQLMKANGELKSLIK